MDNSSTDGLYCSSPQTIALIKSWLFLYLLLLPLFFYVVYVGYKRWKKQQSAMSHSDVFTFTIISMEVLTIVSISTSFSGIQSRNLNVINLGNYFYKVGTIGQMFIHCLTCAERYLAVVHPITYLRLKNRGGVNVSIASVYLLSVAFVGSRHILTSDRLYTPICMLALASLTVAIVVFCSVSVLCVLIRPKPGEGVGNLRRVDQSKRRAFFTITIILAVLMLRFVFFAASYVLFSLGISGTDDPCLFEIVVALSYLPSSAVLPVMFLHKAGKLPKSCVVNKRK